MFPAAPEPAGPASEPAWLAAYAVRADDPTLTWECVVGLDHAKGALRSVVARLASDVPAVRATIPRGVLLTGSTGGGKTLTARVALSELSRAQAASGRGVRLYSAPAADLDAGRLGELGRWLASRDDEDLVVLYLDEVDAVLRRASSAMPRRDPQALAMLSLLDGLDTRDRDRRRTLVVCATNISVGQLEPAAVRPGRLGDCVVRFEALSPEEAAELLRRRLEALLAGPVAWERAVRVMGRAHRVGADVDAVARDAIGLAAEESGGEPLVHWRHVEAAIKRLGGFSSRRARSGRQVAVHEAGHAVCAAAMGLPVSLVDGHGEVPRGEGALGMTETGELDVETRATSLARAAAALGGMVAEQLVLGSANASAEGNMTDVGTASSLVARLWRGGHLVGEGGWAWLSRDSEASDAAMVAVCGPLTVRLMERARLVLAANRPVLDALADRIEVEGYLVADELDAALAGVVPEAAIAGAAA